MYNSHYRSPAAQFSNNPFIDDPSSPSNRYPDIGTLERSGSGYASPGASSGFPTGVHGAGFGQQQQGLGVQQPPQFVQQQQQQQPQPFGGWQQQGAADPYGSFTGAGYGAGPVSPQMTSMPYQGSAFGGGPVQQYPQQQQQYDGYEYNGAGYQMYGGQQPGYGGQAQAPSSVSEFDPLSLQFQTSSSSSSAASSSGIPHPREYIRTHKRELETWDSVSWKQALNAFDALRTAWEAHRGQVELRLRQGGYYLGPVEGQRLQSLQKDADHNIDTITASSVQMQEVLQGYRQSSDFASKNRVRESMNAALQILPEWPPQQW